jgi:hypothetical protein
MGGAIAGYAITTGIMLWGVSVYGDGGHIAFFGIPLSQQGFVLLCLVWYGFDTRTFLRVKNESANPGPLSYTSSENKTAQADPAVRQAWAATWTAWRAGLHNPAAQAEAAKISVDAFVDPYAIKYGGLIAAAARERPFAADEFIVCLTRSGNFVLMNTTLYLFSDENAVPRRPLVVPLHEIEGYRFEAQNAGRLILKLRSGEVVNRRMSFAPKEEIIQRFGGLAGRTVYAAGEIEGRPAPPPFPSSQPALS